MSDQKKFNEIIDFAIKKEREAIKFYQDLQKLVSFKSKKEMLHNFEEIERIHIEVLESIRLKTIKNIHIPRVENLAISDYIVETKADANMSYQDILIVAMKREEKANQLYTRMANESDEEEIKKLFLRLASEEANHKLQFEKIYDNEILTEN